MKREPEHQRRLRLAEHMAEMGSIDTPFVRHFLRGDTVEIWRRDCRCPADCDCWEVAGTRPADDEDRIAFAVAQQPMQRKAEDGRCP